MPDVIAGPIFPIWADKLPMKLMLNAFWTLVGAVIIKIYVHTELWKQILGVVLKLPDGDAAIGIVTPMENVLITLPSKTFWKCLLLKTEIKSWRVLSVEISQMCIGWNLERSAVVFYDHFAK